MKKILSLLIIIAMMLAMSLNSIAYADRFSEEGEIIVNDFGVAPDKTTPDDAVKLFGYSTAKWDTNSENGNPLYINGTYNVDADTYLNLTIYNPSNATDKKIGIYLANGEKEDKGSWKADVGKQISFTLAKKGWNVVQLRVGDFTDGYGTVTEHNYTMVQIHNKQWGGTFYGAAYAQLNIGKIWFSKSNVTNNAYGKEIKILHQNEINIDIANKKQHNQYSEVENVYRITFDYKLDTPVATANFVYAALEMKAKEGTAPTAQPIWMPTDTNWHTFNFEIPEKFYMNNMHIKADYTINSLRDDGKQNASTANVPFKIKNLCVHTSPYGNAVTLLSSSDKIFVSDYAYIAASSAICAGKDAIVTVKNSSGTAVSSSYDIIQNKILIDFEKSAGTTYTIEYSGFYDIEGANEFSGTTAVSVLPNQFEVSYKGETTTDGITRTYSYINGSGEGKNAIVILAVYSSGNVLDKVFINNEDVILANNTYGEISVSVSSAQLGDTTGKTIKSFVFGDLKDIKPLCKAE